ncbi:hypothetical protein GCM10022631_12660 [Deinococcus rubellus]|uniref:Uncharacterized protein n=1 Tax=Deinococcus rubellus TaxID=1889240 RepID=A0ABY5YL47_9DEIO|nr:hypothetical protein [Deinococcus rubellus]UWX64508.1 hypothetical protein N0D28_02225 [Deinococcus rubellus]
MDNPTKPETAQQNSGRADVSQGVNSNLSSADVAETGAAKEIEAAYQRGSQDNAARGIGISQESDASEAEDAARLGQSGEDRNRTP